MIKDMYWAFLTAVVLIIITLMLTWIIKTAWVAIDGF